MHRTFSLIVAFTAASSVWGQTTTPVLFTTNDDPVTAYGPHRVQYITVYVDGVKRCYTESHGNCTAVLQLSPQLHRVDYVWAGCNNPDACVNKIYGKETHFVLVPNQTQTFYVRIPTLRVRWYTKYGVNVSLNGGYTSDAVWAGVALGGGILTRNVMAGCYTMSYKMGYSQPIPSWPSPLPGTPDPSLKGFDRVCFGDHKTYPTPTPDGAGDNNPPHVRITVPDYWQP